MLYAHISQVMTMRGILQRVIKSKRVFRSAIFEHNKGAIQALIYTKSGSNFGACPLS